MRKAVLQVEDIQSTGGRLCLNDLELKVNDIFLKYKSDELARPLPDRNTAHLHFFLAKPLIDSNKVFQFLQKMPKGAALHTHSLGSVSSEGFIKNITYIPGLMRCVNRDNIHILSFRQLAKKHNCYAGYGRVSDGRKGIIDFDNGLLRIISFDTPTFDGKLKCYN